MKALIISGLCLLTIYAPLELSRLIILAGLEPEFIGELFFMWVFYLSAIAILIKVVKV